jgi:hypothetical protein
MSLSHPDEHFVNKGLFHIVSLAKDKNKSITRARNGVLVAEYGALKSRLSDAGFPDGVTSMFVPLNEKGRKRLSRLYRKYSAEDTELGRRIVLLHDLAEFMDDVVSRGMVRRPTSRPIISEPVTSESITSEPVASESATTENAEPAGRVEPAKTPMDVDTCSCKKHLQEFVAAMYERYLHMEGEKARLLRERDAMYAEMNARMEKLHTNTKREREKDAVDLVSAKRMKTVDEFVNHFTGR